MQALRRSANAVIPGLRRMATDASMNADKFWAPYFPKPQITAEQVKKNVSKEMVGFMLLGPIGAGFMLYDFIIGLEEEHHVTIPPYPWMRIRRVPGMPWGEDGLFEGHPRVAKVWPPEEGAEAGHH
ncbi:hypothetical protein PLESTB_001543700 [Pleodorina starrii]|uniref:Uncharacterized protein n=1 Tax=Pleodorina starrii TaxID=330485 RepID=A0A9W6BWK5_9CHLO|nr:hypothetical protein PLESTM_001999600 [Pleodorina starrii]GLC59861.1 hypothetical protein PLESTB_001543700 [Pleodorina starrii]GLC69101.1 hypothetical protein PLESTF_000789300 [Pleodorina starrii]